MTDEELRQLAKALASARIMEGLPSKEKVAEIINAEIRRQAFGLYDREARTLMGESVKSEIRGQIRQVVKAWIEEHVPPALAQIKPNTVWFEGLITAEIELIKEKVSQLVREETQRLISQAIGVQIGAKVAKLLSLFDKVLIQG